MLTRKDDESEAVGLLIDYDYSVDTETANRQHLEYTSNRDHAPVACDTHVAEDTGHSAAGSIPAVTDPDAQNSSTPRTVRLFIYLNVDVFITLLLGYSTLYGYRGPSFN